MKRFTPLFLLLSLPLSANPEDDYVNFIRQIQADGSGEWDLYDGGLAGGSLAPVDTATSYEGVGDTGSDFELWSIYSPTGYQYLLDMQFVASYAPSAQITIGTLDPYPTVKRTRADKGYTVKVEISGLIEAADATVDTPLAAQQVIYTHKTFTHPEGEMTLEGANVQPSVVLDEPITGNGTYPSSSGFSYDVTLIPATDFKAVSGEEHFSITALADFGVEESELETGLIQIWPQSDASIDGLDVNAYYDAVPPITIELSNLYPTSTTWAQVYPGSVNDNPAPDEVRILSDTVFIWNAAIPTSRTLSVSDLDDFANEEGLHTIEIIEETPWGAERIAHQEFNVDRTVRFKGNIISK